MKKISRRHLLQAAGLGAGAALFSPWTRQLGVAQGMRPRRFVFVVEGNGFRPNCLLSPLAREAIERELASPIGNQRWWSRDYLHTEPMVIDTPDLAESIALEALDTHGLSDRASVVLGLSSRIVGGGHTSHHGVLSSTRTVGGSPGGQTIDSFLAQRLAAEHGEGDTAPPFDAVRLGVGSGDTLNYGTCAESRGAPLPLILDPQTAHELLFGAADEGESGRAFMARSDVLAFAHRDVLRAQAGLEHHVVAERTRHAYQLAIEGLQVRQARLRLLRDQIIPYSPAPPEATVSTSALRTFAAQFANGTAALQAGLTNVLVLGSGTGGKFNLQYRDLYQRVGGNIRDETTRHDLEHGADGNSNFLNVLHELAKAQVHLVAQMAADLANTPERDGEGSMLDHTLIVYIGDNGEQHHSSATEFPVLLIGGEGLGLQTGGKTVVYPGVDAPAHRQVSNLWNTVGHLAGYELNDFGDEGVARIQEGPLPELLG